MVPQFKNLQELITRFSDERVCREYFEEMIWKGICDMKKYKPMFYAQNEQYFDELKEFKEVRNYMAHQVGQFLEDGTFHLNYVENHIVDGKELGKIAFQDYSTARMIELLDKFAKINSIFFSLWRIFEYEHQNSSGTNPLIHPSVSPTND